MASRHSLEVERGDCAHYYHCVIYSVPYEMPLSQVAQHVAPQPESAMVKELAALGCRIVPHQLHMYKEPLKAKFGYVSYFVHCSPSAPVETGDVHPRVVRWIAEELVPQLLLVNCQVKLAQPPECHSSEPFLAALNRLCPILDPSDDFDTRKMETYLLTKITFNCEGNNNGFNAANATTTQPRLRGSLSQAEEAAAEEAEEAERLSARRGNSNTDSFDEVAAWNTVGSFALASLSPMELVWLKRELRGFPPLLISNKDVSTAQCDPEALFSYFSSALAPLITVERE